MTRLLPEVEPIKRPVPHPHHGQGRRALQRPVAERKPQTVAATYRVEPLDVPMSEAELARCEEAMWQAQEMLVQAGREAELNRAAQAEPSDQEVA